MNTRYPVIIPERKVMILNSVMMTTLFSIRCFRLVFNFPTVRTYAAFQHLPQIPLSLLMIQ